MIAEPKAAPPRSRRTPGEDQSPGAPVEPTQAAKPGKGPTMPSLRTATIRVTGAARRPHGRGRAKTSARAACDLVRRRAAGASTADPPRANSPAAPTGSLGSPPPRARRSWPPWPGGGLRTGRTAGRTVRAPARGGPPVTPPTDRTAPEHPRAGAPTGLGAVPRAERDAERTARTRRRGSRGPPGWRPPAAGSTGRRPGRRRRSSSAGAGARRPSSWPRDSPRSRCAPWPCGGCPLVATLRTQAEVDAFLCAHPGSRPPGPRVAARPAEDPR